MRLSKKKDKPFDEYEYWVGPENKLSLPNDLYYDFSVIERIIQTIGIILAIMGVCVSILAFFYLENSDIFAIGFFSLSLGLFLLSLCASIKGRTIRFYFVMALGMLVMSISLFVPDEEIGLNVFVVGFFLLIFGFVSMRVLIKEKTYRNRQKRHIY